jgi:hypothetical protein
MAAKGSRMKYALQCRGMNEVERIVVADHVELVNVLTTYVQRYGPVCLLYLVAENY